MSDTLPDECPVCEYARIPGISACVNCGEPFQASPAFGITYLVNGVEVPPLTPAEIDALKAKNASGNQVYRRTMEGRALEIAGDVDGAIRIYEALISEGCTFTPPYQRLAILYRKLKREGDEERVVRAAIAAFGAGPREEFMLRLARILAKRRPD